MRRALGDEKPRADGRGRCVTRRRRGSRRRLGSGRCRRTAKRRRRLRRQRKGTAEAASRKRQARPPTGGAPPSSAGRLGFTPSRLREGATCPPETFPGKFRSSYAHFCTFCFTFRTMSKLYHLNFTFRTQNSNSNHYPNILSKFMATFHLGSTAALFLPNHCPS